MTHCNRRQHRKQRIQSQINITPLIDVLLVLIVIFMVITPVTPTGLTAAIPQQGKSSDTRPKPSQDTLVLSVDKDGTVAVNRRKQNSTAELASSLKDIFKTRDDRTVFVQGSENLEFDVVAQVIDAAIGSGASRVGLLTDKIY